MHLMKPGFASEMEDAINKTNYLLNSIPKIFMSDLSKERIELSKMLLKAEAFLDEEYQREFEHKKKILEELFEKFQRAYIKADVDRVLTSYDEILYQFDKVPDVFLEKKIGLYTKVNELYASINQLILRKSVNTFLESYNYSRVIEEIRDYLDHAKNIGKVDRKTLELVKEKLVNIPPKYNLEKQELEKKFMELRAILSSNEVDTMKYEEELEEEEKKIEHEYNPSDEIKKSNSKVSSNVRVEIDMYFDKIKNSNNRAELKVLYKKLMFYLNVTPMDPHIKQEIMKKTDMLIKAKKLG